MKSINKQTNQENESDACVTASKEQDSTPRNAPTTEKSSYQTAPNNITYAIRLTAEEKRRFRRIRGNGYNTIVSRLLAIDSGVKPENYYETAAAKANLTREMILRRFSILRQKDYEIEVARIIASHPLVSLAQIENFKTKKLHNTVRGFIKSDIPGHILNKLELQKIQDDLQLKLSKLEGIGRKRKFVSYTFDLDGGLLNVECDGNGALAWLKKNITFVKPWPAAKLKVLTETKHEMEIGSYELIATFPNSVKKSSKSIIRFIGAQNKGLLTKHWQLVNRMDKGRDVTLTLNVDKISAGILEELNCLGEIKIQIKRNKPDESHSLSGRQISAKDNLRALINSNYPSKSSVYRNRNDQYSRFKQNRNDPRPLLSNQRDRSNGGPDRDAFHGTPSGGDLFLCRPDNDNRETSSRGGIGRGSQSQNDYFKSRKFSPGPANLNEANEFRNTIDEMRWLPNQQKLSLNNDSEMFPRMGGNNCYENMACENLNQNCGDSHFRDSNFQSDSNFQETNNFRNFDPSRSNNDRNWSRSRHRDTGRGLQTRDNFIKTRDSNFEGSNFKSITNFGSRQSDNDNYRGNNSRGDDGPNELTNQQSLHNDYEIFSRKSNINHPNARANDNYYDSTSYGNSNYRDSSFQLNSDFKDRNTDCQDRCKDRRLNFQDSSYQINSDFRERSPNFRDSRAENLNFCESGFQNSNNEGISNNYDGNSSYRNNFGNSSNIDKFRRPSFQNSSNNFGNFSTNFENSNYKSSNFQNMNRSGSLRSGGICDNFDANRKSLQNNNSRRESGGWQRR